MAHVPPQLARMAGAGPRSRPHPPPSGPPRSGPPGSGPVSDGPLESVVLAGKNTGPEIHLVRERAGVRRFPGRLLVRLARSLSRPRSATG